MKIFISHSSKDKEIVDFFIDKILILGCGVKEDNIFCTSIEGLGIKTGLDFREHIKTNLLNSDYSFLLISKNYKQSEICLNEMGASWAQENIIVKPFLLPNMDYNSVGFLYNVKQVAKIDKSSDLDELFEELSALSNIDTKISRWNKYKHDFLTHIKSLQTNEVKFIENSANTFFSQFVRENANINHLFLKSHPNILDCKAVFNEEYYKHFFKCYCETYESMIEKSIETFYPKNKFYKIYRNSVMDLLSDGHMMPGGMSMLAKKNIFKYNAEFFSIHFTEEQASKSGIRFSVFSYVNDKWVFFPTPWRYI